VLDADDVVRYEDIPAKVWYVEAACAEVSRPSVEKDLFFQRLVADS
jgi:hypothetical protein